MYKMVTELGCMSIDFALAKEAIITVSSYHSQKISYCKH